MRERDAAMLNEAVLTIIADAAERMAMSRKSGTESTSLDEDVEIVDWGVRTFASYVGKYFNCLRVCNLRATPGNRMDRY